MSTSFALQAQSNQFGGDSRSTRRHHSFSAQIFKERGGGEGSYIAADRVVGSRSDKRGSYRAPDRFKKPVEGQATPFFETGGLT